MERLRLDGVERLWVGGLAQDVCVLATALDARALDIDVILPDRATRSVTKEGAGIARRKMVRAGVLFFPDLGEVRAGGTASRSPLPS